jgi:Ca-activated chloride channel family protein
MGKIIVAILLSVLCSAAFAQKEQKLVYQGNELYKKQQFDKAAAQYQKAADINAKNPVALYNLGNAFYKSKKIENAEKAFEAAADNAKDATAKSQAYYNKGVTLSRQKKLIESIDAYKNTLRINPTDQQARENLQKALNELKKQPPKQGGGGGGDDNKKDKQNEPKQEKNNSKLNQKQVEQMLNNLRNEEKRLQQNVQKKNNQGQPNSKDW